MAKDNTSKMTAPTTILTDVKIPASTPSPDSMLNDVAGLLDNATGAASNEAAWHVEAQEFWTPAKIGDSVVGVYLGKEKRDKQRYTTHRLAVKDSKTGAPTLLNLKGSRILSKELARGAVKQAVRITYNGPSKSDAGQKIPLYKVEWFRK